MDTEQAVEILLIEDNPHDVELTLHAFNSQNLANKVHVVRNGEEALNFIFGENLEGEDPIEKHPKLILLDLKLPKIDGLEVLQKLKGDSRTKSIPVVMLTSSAEENDMIESYKLGVNSYIVKPVDFKQFNEAVKNLGLYWVLLNQFPGKI
ncbi:MAG: response regulator [Armatimonadota bacterium]